MKNRSFFLNFMIIITLLLFASTFTYSFGITDDFGYIISKFEVLGFKVGNIVSQKDGSIKVDVVGFTKNSKAVSLRKGKFIPFKVSVKIVKTVHILKSDLKDYSVNSKYLKSDIKMVPKLFQLTKIKVKNW